MLFEVVPKPPSKGVKSVELLMETKSLYQGL